MEKTPEAIQTQLGNMGLLHTHSTLLGNMGLFHTPSTLNEITDWITNLPAEDRRVAWTTFAMFNNFIVDRLATGRDEKVVI